MKLLFKREFLKFGLERREKMLFKVEKTKFFIWGTTLITNIFVKNYNFQNTYSYIMNIPTHLTYYSKQDFCSIYDDGQLHHIPFQAFIYLSRNLFIPILHSRHDSSYFHAFIPLSLVLSKRKKYISEQKGKHNIKPECLPASQIPERLLLTLAKS